MNTGNRRPLKSRGSWWSKIITAGLLRVGATPNQVSLASIVFAIGGGASLLLLNQTVTVEAKLVLLLVSVIGIQGRLLCNLVDGMLAVEGGKKSRAGEIYNDFPDRVSDLVLLLSAGYSIQADGALLISGSVLGWVAATLAVLTAYVRVLGVSSGTPHFFDGPMAKQHRMAILTAGCVLRAGEICLGFKDRVFSLVLWIVIIGSLITIIRRSIRIVRCLESKQ